jgi:hypothetical protein
VLQYGKGFTLYDPDIARTVLSIFWMLAEPVRLAAGWYGNLQENVSGWLWLAVAAAVDETWMYLQCRYLY